MVIIVRGDLSPGYQIAQSNHALAEFIFEYPDEAREWHKNSKYIVVLNVKDEDCLIDLSDLLSELKIKYSLFFEPDIDYQLTAIAIDPSYDLRKITSNFPLALKEVGKKLR